MVVLIEKGAEVFSQIMQMRRRQRTNDAKIQCDIRRIGRIGRIDHDVARMHIRVEKVVAKNLGIKNFHTAARQHFQVHVGRFEAIQIVDGDAGYALHHHDVFFAVRPVNLWHVKIA